MIYIPGYQQGRTGGGWTFQNNLAEGLGDMYTDDPQKADVWLIAGATTVDRDVIANKPAGTKLVLRVDNHLPHSRNRGTGMTRMYDFAQEADLIIYQSAWARDYLATFLGKDGPVILNGCDLDTFYPSKDNKYPVRNSYLYVKSSRADTKNWEMARYYFSRMHQKYAEYDMPIPQLSIIGKFARETIEYAFDFYNEENFIFYNEQPTEVMAELFRQHQYFLFPYFNDACSNTLIEALCSGCEPIYLFGMEQTGGTPEITEIFDKHGREYFSLERMTREYIEVIYE